MRRIWGGKSCNREVSLQQGPSLGTRSLTSLKVADGSRAGQLQRLLLNITHPESRAIVTQQIPLVPQGRGSRGTGWVIEDRASQPD